jgi:hypothetical protein
MLPALPMDRMLPALPMLRMLPALPIDSTLLHCRCFCSSYHPTA